MRSAIRLPNSRQTPTLVLIVGLTVWWAAVIALPTSLTAHGQVAAAANNLSGEVLVAAGIACFALGRMLRRGDALRLAVAFIILGMALPALGILTSWTIDGISVAPRAVVLRGIVLIPVFVLLNRRPPPVAPARAVSARTLVLTSGVPVVSIALLGEELSDWFGFAADRAVAVTIEITAMLCWVLLGLQRRRQPGSLLGRWGGAGMYLMAATEFLGALGLTGIVPPIGLIGGVQLAGAITLTVIATSKLRDAYRRQRAQQHALSDALAHTGDLLVRLEQTQRERLHDARSAVVGVIGASELLATPPAGPGVDARALQRLIAAELTRLQGMLDTDVSEPICDFRIADVFDPILLAHQLDGANIRIESLAGDAHGRPRACATVLDNLLRNARTHAPGATIVVSADSKDERVTIVVEDDGPGIPVAERTAVLLPGVRGSTAQVGGDGLGLHSCLAAMHAQRGDIALGESAAGGLQVTLRLPAATGLPQLIAS